MIRSTSERVTFRRAFSLKGLDGPQPAGSYQIDTDEELIDGLSFPVWRRVATTIRLPLPGHGSGSTQTFPIDPRDLAAAQARDAAAADTVGGRR
jgi:hypothetical protein